MKEYIEVKVLKRFKDKHDPRKGYKEGEVIKVSKERYEEILRSGKFVEPVAVEPTVAQVTQPVQEAVVKPVVEPVKEEISSPVKEAVNVATVSATR